MRDHAVAAREFAAAPGLSKPHVAIHNVECNLGVRQQAELLTDVLRNRDLTFGGDARVPVLPR